MSTDSAFRQMAEDIARQWQGGLGWKPLADLIETALAAAWAQGRDAAAEVAEETSGYYSGMGNGEEWAGQDACNRIAAACRALTPAAVPSKENG